MKPVARSETRSYQRVSAANSSRTYSNGPSALAQAGFAQKTASRLFAPPQAGQVMGAGVFASAAFGSGTKTSIDGGLIPDLLPSRTSSPLSRASPRGPYTRP